MSATVARWLRYLVIILLGNGLYYAVSPYLPPGAQHKPATLDLGIVVDFWFCLLVYGVFELAHFLRAKRRG